MEKSSKLKVVGLTLAGLSVLVSGSALAASLKVGGAVQTDFAWFDDDVSHPNRVLGYGAGNLGFDNQSNVSSADVYLRGTLVDRWVYNLSVSHVMRDGRAGDDSAYLDQRRNGPYVLDAWVGWDRFDPWARFSMGRMNVSQGLENTGNRSAYTFIAPAAGQRSFVVGRADGLTMEGNPTRWLGYQMGAYFHTTNAGAQGAAPGTAANIDTSSQVVVSNVGNHMGMYSARAFVQPWVLPGRVMHLGGSYSMVNTKGDVSLNAAPGGYFNNSNAQLVRLSSANGAALARNGVLKRTDGYDVWGFEGLGVWGPFHVQAEYTHFKLDLANAAKTDLVTNNAGAVTDELKANGWYVQGSWMLTGDTRHYDPVSGTLGKVKPRHAKWGAWELAGRYDKVNFAKTANVTGATSTATTFCGDLGSVGGATGCTNGGKMTDWTLGLNWYANSNVKLMANYTWAEGKYAEAAGDLGPNFGARAHDRSNHSKRSVDVFAVKGQVDF
ncbi:MAG: hypothetical protein KBD64_05320 [Gammaproteobacteria bacterium]|nr:hypothetical protein [Gammaproteobacteria bacterium]